MNKYYKRLAYAYPSSTIGGKDGLWYITLRQEDTISKEYIAMVFSSIDKDRALEYYNTMDNAPSKYSLV